MQRHRVQASDTVPPTIFVWEYESCRKPVRIYTKGSRDAYERLRNEWHKLQNERVLAPHERHCESERVSLRDLRGV